jgi:predicted nucleic acid-binding protein
VVDASVGVKLFLAEDLSEVAESLFFGPWNGRQRFFVPDLFYSECSNIFWKHVRRLGYPPDEARESLQDLKSLTLLSVSSTSLLSSAFELALDYGISAYDASYAALAQELSLPLITADEKLVGKLEGSGTEVLWLGDFGS